MLALLLLLCRLAIPRHTSRCKRNDTDLTVSAAISLKDALDAIKQAYASQDAGVSLSMNYGASGTLQLQIEQGAPVDVYHLGSAQADGRA